MEEIKLVKNKSGKIFIKTTIEIVKAEHEEMGMCKIPCKIVPFVFNPSNVISYRPTSSEDNDDLLQTAIELGANLEPYTINCNFETFERVFLSL